MQNFTNSFVIEEKDRGLRLDLVITSLVDDFSRTSVQKLIKDGNVKVNGELETKQKRKVVPGEKVEIILPPVKELEIKPENIPVDIVYEDDSLMVINKKKGMVVHPAPGNYNGTLVNALLYHCKDRLSSINGVLRPGIVHRIDKDTTGLLIVAKTDSSHKNLVNQLSERKILREYHLIAHGKVMPDKGKIDLPIGRDPNNRLKMAVTDRNSKEAITRFNVLKRYDNFTYLIARLETGRTHQIRVHFSYINHPLLGDLVYGKKNKFKIEGQMLHAKKLSFAHPESREQLNFDSELPEDFKETLVSLE